MSSIRAERWNRRQPTEFSCWELEDQPGCGTKRSIVSKRRPICRLYNLKASTDDEDVADLHAAEPLPADRVSSIDDEDFADIHAVEHLSADMVSKFRINFDKSENR